jgi:SNF2 family DNA or RNA helicase
MNRRNTVLDAFRTSTCESGPRVLILSGVGIVGLNLACANILVVMVRAMLVSDFWNEC